ncbi:energy-coupling factor ABC transporter ATP-binding protein [Fructobacillus sp. M1-13]|uniref:ABC transporter ATP-binding protein n=1 Tax=Fructobacillus papyriferae TaxID=2713171 RepID=A0ABS5QQ48_9LACO|nr:ABC transporter ATP-binding protein [Fructobacillus papyriferae]MBS9335220.1 ABC transporter ATP-binding protein [Fructobacillus papyriferae]MCD2159111.1 energy-coupling factor ABC transporter ATP-binding protein [Fructobacillus papyriferae]
MTDSVLQFKDLSFRYHSQAEETLKNLNFTIQRGSKTLVLGPSGSGKSTLIALINALVTEKEGEIDGQVIINDEDQAGTDSFDRSLLVGTILQDTDRQFVGLTVAEDIAFVLENEAEAVEKLRAAVANIADKLGLTNLLPLGPEALSGGQKQRVAMAGVLVGNSPILVLDEPLASLDPQTGQAVLATIEQLHQDGITIMMVEHRLDEVLRQGVDHVLVLKNGELVFDGQAEDLLKNSRFHDWQLAQPAYLSLIEQAGYSMQNLEHIDDVQKVTGPNLKQQLQQAPKARKTAGKGAQERLPAALEAKNLTYSYGHRTILDDVSLTIDANQWLALIGENGSGKSTLARLIAGFLPVQQGRVFSKSDEVNDATVDLAELSLAEQARYVGYVSQNPNEMLIGLSVFEEVATGLRLHHVAEEVIEETVHFALKKANLYPYRHWQSQSLSFGQKRRLSVLSVAILEPKVLILDEPTAGQDDVSAKGLLEYLRLLQDSGIALVTVTHDMGLIEKWADQVVSLVAGRLTAKMTPVELFSQRSLLEQTSLIVPSDQILLTRIEREGSHD